MLKTNSCLNYQVNYEGFKLQKTHTLSLKTCMIHSVNVCIQYKVPLMRLQ